ncbi:MAG: dipicolinate synthase subunit B [Bacillota bacterium]|nr:dipicolinate synthase subunit B [Bacillota bacterium]
MLLEGLKIGIAVSGSFCTFDRLLEEIEKIVAEGADVQCIFSYSVSEFDTRFGAAGDFKDKVMKLTGHDIITTIIDAEPIGPKKLFDVLVVAPCTGNTLSKLANAIIDTPVTMACKAHLRNQRPLIITISTNDGLSNNAKNLGTLLNMKYVFFVPFGQDDPIKKCNSLIAQFDQIIPTIQEALKGNQLQPLLV